MENKKQDQIESKILVFEICIKLSSRDYRFKLATRRTWVVAIGVLILKIILSRIFIGAR